MLLSQLRPGEEFVLKHDQQDGVYRVFGKKDENNRTVDCIRLVNDRFYAVPYSLEVIVVYGDQKAPGNPGHAINVPTKNAYQVNKVRQDKAGRYVVNPGRPVGSTNAGGLAKTAEIKFRCQPEFKQLIKEYIKENAWQNVSEGEFIIRAVCDHMRRTARNYTPDLAKKLDQLV